MNVSSGKLLTVVAFMNLVQLIVFIRFVQPIYHISTKPNDNYSFNIFYQKDSEPIKYEPNTRKKPRFDEVFLSFPWEKYNYYLHDAPVSLRKEFLYNMSLFIEMEPLVPINDACKRPVLESRDNIKCEDYHLTLTNKKRLKPVKAAHMLDFGFDVDVLEIQLNELYPVVDKIFIIEQKYSHKQSTPKPLMWERVNNQPRFKKFEDKVVHFVMDDVEMLGSNDTGIWRNEDLQEKTRWRKFLEWNDRVHYFSDDDIIGFGDADEIPSMHNINILKNCEFDGSVDIGIWFTHGTINKRYKSDFPVRGHPYTFGDPTYYHIKYAKSLPKYPSRSRGKSKKFLLGGLHYSRNHYLPFIILKNVCMTSGTKEERSNYVKGIVDLMKRGINLNRIQYIQKDKILAFYNKRMLDVTPDMLGKDEYILPWFLQCNLRRYPTFMNDTIPDERLL